MKNKIRVAVLGSTGYVGMELVKILSNHSYVDINFLGADYTLETMEEIIDLFKSFKLGPN